MAPIDPCDVDQSLEEIFQLQIEYKDESTEVFVKSDDKVTYSGAPIYHMIIGGMITKIHEQSIDENGLKTISNLLIDDLLMSSETWRKEFNLQSFGEIISNSSLHTIVQSVLKIFHPIYSIKISGSKINSRDSLSSICFNHVIL